MPKTVALPKTVQRFNSAGHDQLPGAASATVTLPTGTTSSGTSTKHTTVGVAATGPVRAGTTPISIARITLPGTSTTGSTGAASSPVTTSPSQVEVSVASQATAQAAGIHGMLFTAQSTGSAGGPVQVSVDDSTFSEAYGGNYAARLHLVQLPACALTTPQLASCQKQTPVSSVSAATPLTAQVSLPDPVPTAATRTARAATASAVVTLAATSGASGSTGDYTATSLTPGGSWSTAGNTGAFTYSYPIPTPAAIGGAAPSIALSYDSSSQDARTAGTNNQSSWVGDGWSTNDSYIERTYRSCSDDTSSGAPTGDGDECWNGQILTMSLGGKTTAIVYDAGNTTNPFHLAADDGTTKVENLTGATNGTTNGEYFKVTEGGTQYFFGLNHLPGWATGDATTQSAWTEPVYQAHSGISACPSGSFASTSCTLGYRFNLDYTVDLHGNATAYYYNPEANYYGADAQNTAVAYTRGGTLARIDYGMTSSTIYSATAPEQIVFNASAERCIVGTPSGNSCTDTQFTVANPQYWPDTPIDQNCASGSSCTNHAPTFWSRKRLTTITTQVQVAGATKQVDQYTLAQHFPDGDLWLDSITHTGLDTGGGDTSTTPTPTVSFTPYQLINRVGTIPGMPALDHDRIGTITSETGAQTTVTYNDKPDCSSAPASDPNDPTDAAAKGFASTNTLWCFPVYWTPTGQPNPMMDWFYLHPVKQVQTLDLKNSYQDGTEPSQTTAYTYGTPGWHYDDNETVKAKYRTWGQFRGFSEVDTTTGTTTTFHLTNKAQVFDQRTLSKAHYFLGMNGDTMPSGTRSVSPLASQDGTVSVADDNALAGQVFETDTYTDATGTTIDKAVVTVPTILGPTATRTRTGLPDLTAQMVRTAKILTRQAVSYGWRKTETDTFYNTTLGQPTTGMPVQSDDRGEPTATGNVTRCTFTRYLTNSSELLVVLAQTTVTTQDCTSANATASGTLISDTRSSFDGHAFTYDGATPAGTAPTKGEISLTEKASAASGAAATAYVAQSSSAFDSYGRVTQTVRTPNSTSASGASLAQSVATSYTPATGALPTSVVTATQVTPGATCTTATATSKTCEVATIVLDAARALPVTKTDVAGLVTTLTYDALGRMTAVWLPNESKASSAPANTTYSYTLSASAPSVVATHKLLDNGSYSTSETLYDAMLQPIQTQATAENGTVTVSDTEYDSHGWTVVTNNSYSVSGTPGGSLVSVSQVSIPDTTVTDHDAMGRATQVSEEAAEATTWTTRTAYTNDTTTVIPPTGGVATTTTVDARGQKTALEQYTSAPTLTGSPTAGFAIGAGTGAGTTTSYTFTPAGQQHTVTSPDNSAWTFAYDLMGRKTSQSDPDVGASTYGYDDAGNQTSATDARGIELDYTYDLMGRKLTGTDKSKSNFEFASWLYDTLRIGQPTSSTSYVQGTTGGYTVATLGYTTLGKPSGTKITLPAAEAPLPTTTTITYGYTTNDQLLTTQSDPEAYGMSAENLQYGYDALGNPISNETATDIYAASTVYSDFSQPLRITLGASTDPAYIVNSYDTQTLHLSDRQISRTLAPGPLVDDTQYTYDASGNPTSATDLQSETGSTVTDRQCFAYDALDRLTSAWTTSSTACPTGASTPAASTVSTTAGSYWQSFSYDVIGDRVQSIDHATGTGSDTTTAYTDGCTGTCANGTQPHTLTATTGANPTNLTYDADGNLLTRTPTTGTAQTLTWDDQGHLQKVTTGTTSTSYVYDADGNQLLRRDPGQTIFFAGDTEMVVNTALTTHKLIGAIRTYTFAGTPIAMRSSMSGGGLDYLFTDLHGTPSMAMDVTTQQVARQQYKPYGEKRASANTTLWPDATHSYLDKPQDASTGYADIGARKYDATIGRFISDDPLLNTADPQSFSGYAYADSNPIKGSDPSGQMHQDIGGHTETLLTWDCGDSNGSCGGVGNITAGDVGNAAVGFADTLAEGAKSLLPGSNYMAEAVSSAYNYATSGNFRPSGWSVAFDAHPLATSLGINTSRKSYQAGGFLATMGMLLAAPEAGAEDDAALALGGCSFAPTTPVLLAGGTQKAIGKIKAGDTVESADPGTGKDVGGRTVQHVWINHDNDLLDVTVNTGNGHPSVIHTTANHPFWDDTTRTWTRADHLKAGDKLASTTGHHPTVLNVKTTPGAANRWNLTVAQLHTYYVLAGNMPVLVHNTCGGIPYNSNELSNAAYNGRVAAGVSPGRNVAVARVPGWNDPKIGDLVYGFSKVNGYHSENHILDQLKARSFEPSQITELYSGPQPCSVCWPILDGALSPGTPINWSVPWGMTLQRTQPPTSYSDRRSPQLAVADLGTR
ncbi:polymorphic toxin-type HINT domain-containing protein [Streptacidiphilus sp. EB103A]|uniref:polymorphic toxin-type HINT domain-containing protein n=1 Tax=Streptacidiphilus sp. EB103A TaxID=3156275 RepID=UPI003514C780